MATESILRALARRPFPRGPLADVGAIAGAATGGVTLLAARHGVAGQVASQGVRVGLGSARSRWLERAQPAGRGRWMIGSWHGSVEAHRR
jgi:hypothetical protein